MNRNEKFLRSLPRSLRDKIEMKIDLLLSNHLNNLDIKKLKGDKGYRLRIGRIRILFRFDENRNPDIFFIGFRDSITYKRH
jgi:mRNA-degrading endonuclease RelE of RelBE toxin-antitoxin system